ncbi:hypothetical protein AM1_4756 [Acaryochloris marina MBIC11017]|uniref:Uncharacterized protein n=1 Tax=Acaryochloris marina (strain MBIC 11017) TaxID=329726 RepID=B0C2D8_ACAM1|nr:hypothetical protein AM1_4756 [Acaryochloris marina MBIC11017]
MPPLWKCCGDHDQRFLEQGLLGNDSSLRKAIVVCLQVYMDRREL